MTCQGCGGPLPARSRKWCSERCRRTTLYSGTCEVCGAKTDGSNGRGRAPKRCAAHQAEVISERMTVEHGPMRDRIAAMWNDGATIEEVQRVLGYASIPATRVYLFRLRHWYGYDLVDGRSRARAAAVALASERQQRPEEAS